MATSSLSHGTGVRHGADGSSTVPDWCFAPDCHSPRRSRVAIHQDMHISVARSGELCDGRPYLGGTTRSRLGPGGRRSPCSTVPRCAAASSARNCARCAPVPGSPAARRPGCVGWHQSKVSRIETGASGVKPADVRLLLDAYGVDDAELRELLLALGGLRRTAAGGTTGGTRTAGVLPPTYRDFISLESQAERDAHAGDLGGAGAAADPGVRAGGDPGRGGRAWTTTSWTRWWRCGWPGRTCCGRSRRWS